MNDFQACVSSAFGTVFGQTKSHNPASYSLRDTLTADARRHRVAGLLYAGCEEIRALEGSQRMAYALAARSARLLELSTTIAQRARADGLRLVFLKGPALALQAWPDPALRDYDDLDVRVDVNDRSRLDTILAREAFRPLAEEEPIREGLWRYGWGVTYEGPQGMRIEANHRFFPRHYPLPHSLSHAGLPVPTSAGDPIPMPEPGLHLLYAALHAVWHGWERISWLVDLAGLTLRHPESLTRAYRLAQASPFARRALESSLALAYRFLGITDPTNPAGAPAGVSAQTWCEENGAWRRSLPLVTQRRLQHSMMNRAERIHSAVIGSLTPGKADLIWCATRSLPSTTSLLIRPFRGAWSRLAGTRRAGDPPPPSSNG